jgi:hypothetical protein
MDRRDYRRAVIGVALIAAGIIGSSTLHGYLWPLLALAGVATLFYGWARSGGGDIYGKRSEYPIADDLRRADDPDETPPYPGPMPPAQP